MIQFPTTPQEGEQYTENEKSWQWNGVSWDMLAVPNLQVKETKEAAVSAAESAASAAQSASAAGGYASDANGSQLVASAAEFAAETAAAQATTAASTATTAQTTASTAATTAMTKAGEAAASATSALASKTAAETAATTATTKASEIGVKHTETLTAATAAQDWAVKLGAPVSGGLYSAQYYAQQAQAAAGAATTGQEQANWIETDTLSKAFIRNKPILFSGSYSDLTNKPAPVELTNASVITALGYTPWHGGNDGAGSGLDADLLDGANADTAATANTLAKRDSGGSVAMDYARFMHVQATRNADTVFYSSVDDYARKNTAAGFKASLALNNVNNTADANKPVSTATQAALDTKLDKSGGTLTGPLTLASDGVNAMDAVTKQQLDQVGAPVSQLHAVALSF